MIVTVQTLASRNLSVDKVQPSDTVQQLQEAFASIEGIPADNFRLIFTGKTLQEELTVEACGVAADVPVVMVNPFRAG